MMRRSSCPVAVCVAVGALLAGCAQPASKPASFSPARPTKGMFSERQFGAYPPAPVVRRARIRWAKSPSERTAVRRLASERYRSTVGRLSVDMEWPRLTYVQVTKSPGDGVGGDPDAIVLGTTDGRRRTILRTRSGRLVESARLSFPWLVWLERSTYREWQWDLVVLNIRDNRRVVIASGSDSGLGKKQFVPNVALNAGVVVWDQRVRAGRRAANVIRAFDLARRRLWTVDRSGRGHMPDVHEGMVVWNEEIARNVGGRVSVRSDLYTAGFGKTRRRATRSGFAMFASICDRTLAWLDLRREWLDQPAITDVFYSHGGEPPVQVTRSGLVDRVMAGEEMLAWQDAAGKVCALDLRTNRGYVLAGAGAREALLCDVEDRKVVYELQPDANRQDEAREMVVVELR